MDKRIFFGALTALLLLVAGLFSWSTHMHPDTTALGAISIETNNQPQTPFATNTAADYETDYSKLRKTIWSQSPELEQAWWVDSAKKLDGWYETDEPCYAHRHDTQEETSFLIKHPEVLPKAVKAAVIMLMGSDQVDIDRMRYTLPRLHKFFLAKFRYPLYIMTEGDATRHRELEVLLGNATDGLDIHWFDPQFDFPPGYDPEKIPSQVHQVKRSPWGYHHMIRFWSVTLLHHPAVRDLDYYMRLDTDSFLYSHIEFDVFAYMKKHKIAFGYRNCGFDHPAVTQGIWPWFKDFLTNNRVHPPNHALPSNLSRIATENLMPMVYNNFEIIDVARWLRSDLQLMSSAFDLSYGTYVWRWNDAIFRWFAAAAFLRDEEMHRFCHFSYIHSHLYLKPFTCFTPLLLGTDCGAMVCDKEPQDDQPGLNATIAPALFVDRNQNRQSKLL